MGVNGSDLSSPEDKVLSSTETLEIPNSDVQELKISITYGDQKMEVPANQPWHVSVIDGKLSVEVPVGPAAV